MNLDLIENHERKLLVIIVTTCVVLIIISAIITHNGKMNAQLKNCNVLVDSERIMMEGDPTFSWRMDSYFTNMWFSEHYQCDKFYDIEEIMGSWEKGVRLSTQHFQISGEMK